LNHNPLDWIRSQIDALVLFPFRRSHAKPAFKGSSESAQFGIAAQVGQPAHCKSGLVEVLAGNGLPDFFDQLPEGGSLSLYPRQVVLVSTGLLNVFGPEF
jgi:hypothetical protein